MSHDFLRIDKVSKRFGATVALDAVDLTIGKGELFSLLGPSGCGKTTLLRAIAGFAFPDTGAIFIEGEDVTDAPPERRPTNMVFQSYAIFPHLDVFDNVAYGLRRARLQKTDLTRRVEEALAMVRLDGMGGRKSDQLSGGQRQRVALARALIRRPKVLLLDEPLGALDKRLREAMQLELRTLQRDVGITFVFVTHDQEEALSMSDRVAVMSEGRALQVAAPRALYEAPCCREVADFIGTMNFLEATVRALEGEGIAADAGAIGIVRAARVPEFARHLGARVLLAVRPENVVLSETEGAIRATLSAATYLGERSHFQAKVDGLAHPIAVSVANAAGGAHALQPGATVHLSFPPDAIVVLKN